MTGPFFMPDEILHCIYQGILDKRHDWLHGSTPDPLGVPTQRSLAASGQTNSQHYGLPRQGATLLLKALEKITPGKGVALGGNLIHSGRGV